MAKIDYKKLRNELVKRTDRYADGVRALYDQALADIAKEFASVDYNPDEPFSFGELGKFDKVDAIMRRLEGQIQQVVENGIVSEFGVAYKGCSELIKQVVGEEFSRKVEEAFAPKVSSGNAAKAFIRASRDGSITASQRVWNGAVLGQMETAVEEALMDGVGAKKMATLLEDYLVNPDDCFRRFRVKTGVDAGGKSMYGRRWKKRITHRDGSTSWKNADPRDYPAGQGVYHSSYKNALRYARTTTNIAYRSAEHDRYQELPFVIAIDIHISNNPAHVRDICDDLQGRYPKDFPWNGWHTNCMCYQVPVLAKKEEVDEMVDEILDGGDPNDVEIGGVVKELPDNFVRWAKANKERIAKAEERGTLPYFIRDYRDEVYAAMRRHIPRLLPPDEYYSKVVERFAMENWTRKSVEKSMKELFLENPIYKFDVLQFESEFDEVIKPFGDAIKSRRIVVDGGQVNFKFETKKGTVISRSFGRLDNGEVRVDHEVFKVAEELQRNGISKQVFRHLYEGYKRAGVDVMTVYANITNGGYTWARYGFSYRHKQSWLEHLIKEAGKEKGIDVSEALSITAEWYKKNDYRDPFPMNLLTGYDWSRKLMEGEHFNWDGLLRMDDIIQMQVFESYLGI